jgi:hypothetical protein
MEKVTFYESMVEFEEKSTDGGILTDWMLLGSFKTNRDAEYAGLLYSKAFNDTLGKRSSMKCTGVYKVKAFEYPNELAKTAHIMTIDDFVKQNSITKGYSSEYGSDAMQKLLKSVGVETKEERELRIIESLINDYRSKLGFALKVSSISDKTIEEFKETLDYLEGVRNSKLNLGE